MENNGMAEKAKLISSEAAVGIDGPVLQISEEDLSADLRNALHASKRPGDKLLGSDGDLAAIYDELPGAIARRLKRITPSEFRVAKITLKLQLDVNIAGFKMGGTVDVTLEPAQK